jgi:crossover junction endodeoxyribonuclease RuvC
VTVRAAKKDEQPRVILGIDPGSVATGWGVVQAVGGALEHLGNGTIMSSSAEPQAMRLRRIYQGLQKVLREYQPHAVSLEKVFFAQNVQSTLKLGQARGVALLAAAEHGIVVHEYAATEIKNSVVGYGHATKEQVQKMVAALLRLPGKMAADAADALAAAICHVHRQSFQARLLSAVKPGAAIMRRRVAP